MAENIALLTTISRSNNGETVAHIKGKYSYEISFEVVGSAYIELRLKHPVTNKLLRMLNQHCNFITGAYSFPCISLDDAELIVNISGEGIINDLSVMKG